MATIAEILAVMRPDRAYEPRYIAALIENQWRRDYPNDKPRECKNIHQSLARLVDSGRLRYLAQGGYALPLNPPKPKPKKKPKPSSYDPAEPRRRVLKPPSLLYRARRLGL